MSKLADRLGKRVKELREQHGLSQGELARAAGTSQKVLSLIENGKVSTSLDMVDRLAHQLDVSPSELIGVGGQMTVESGRPVSEAKRSHPAYLELLALIPSLDDTKAKLLLTHAKKLAATTLGDPPLKAEPAKARKGHKGPN